MEGSFSTLSTLSPVVVKPLIDSNKAGRKEVTLPIKKGNERIKNPYIQMKVIVRLMFLKLSFVFSTIKERTMDEKNGIMNDGIYELSPLKNGIKRIGRRRMNEMTPIILPNLISLFFISLQPVGKHQVSLYLKRAPKEYHYHVK